MATSFLNWKRALQAKPFDGCCGFHTAVTGGFRFCNESEQPWRFQLPHGDSALLSRAGHLMPAVPQPGYLGLGASDLRGWGTIRHQSSV